MWAGGTAEDEPVSTGKPKASKYGSSEKNPGESRHDAGDTTGGGFGSKTPGFDDTGQSIPRVKAKERRGVGRANTCDARVRTCMKPSRMASWRAATDCGACGRNTVAAREDCPTSRSMSKYWVKRSRSITSFGDVPVTSRCVVAADDERNKNRGKGNTLYFATRIMIVVRDEDPSRDESLWLVRDA